MCCLLLELVNFNCIRNGSILNDILKQMQQKQYGKLFRIINIYSAYSVAQVFANELVFHPSKIWKLASKFPMTILVECVNQTVR